MSAHVKVPDGHIVPLGVELSSTMASLRHKFQREVFLLIVGGCGSHIKLFWCRLGGWNGFIDGHPNPVETKHAGGRAEREPLNACGPRRRVPSETA